MGDQYTMHALMAIMAKMVWALDMKVPEGTDLSVEGGFDDGLMMKPRENVTVEFEVRDGRRERVEEEWQKGERMLERMLGKC